MNTTPQLLDVVALLTDVPAHGLLRGQVGTVVELLDGAYEVEFSDDEGKTYAELALQSEPTLVGVRFCGDYLHANTHGGGPSPVPTRVDLVPAI